MNISHLLFLMLLMPFNSFAMDSPRDEDIAQMESEPDEDGWTLLHRAARDGKHGIIDILCRNGCDKYINAKAKTKKHKHEWTPLFFAVYNNSSQIIDVIKTIEKLYQWKADLNAQDEHGNTPLHICACTYDNDNNIESMQKLLELGADIYITNNNGYTPLQCISVPPAAHAGILGKEMVLLINNVSRESLQRRLVIEKLLIEARKERQGATPLQLLKPLID